MNNKNYETMTEQDLWAKYDELERKLCVSETMLRKANLKKDKLEVEHQLAESYYKKISALMDHEEYRFDCEYTYTDQKAASKKLDRLSIALREINFKIGTLTVSIKEMKELQDTLLSSLHDETDNTDYSDDLDDLWYIDLSQAFDNDK